jgi:hypothetical protein
MVCTSSLGLSIVGLSTEEGHNVMIAWGLFSFPRVFDVVAVVQILEVSIIMGSGRATG